MNEVRSATYVRLPLEAEQAAELVCPVCGCDGAGGMTHFAGEVRQYHDHDDYSSAALSGCGNRGGSLVVDMWSECGHKWKLVFAFHKGTMMMIAKDVETKYDYP